MNAGGVMQKGTPVDLFEQPANTFVGNFIGSPGMNFFSAKVENGVASLAGTKLLEVPSGTQANGDPSDVIGVRPEFVRWHSTPADQRVPVTVTKLNDVGTAVMATFTVDGATGMARLPISDRPETGPGWVSFSRLQLFRNGDSLDNCKPIGLAEGASRA